MPEKRTNEEFEELVNELYNNKYEFPDHNYSGSNDFIYPICPMHGRFKTTPNRLLLGDDCAKCRSELKFQKKKQEFFEKVRVIHNFKYEYLVDDYVNKTTPIIIICPTHGKFEEKPCKHLRGHGCLKCIGRNKTNEEYIKQASDVHNNFYNYSITKYKKYDELIEIICPIHGKFEQMPTNHLQGQGCRKCATIKRALMLKYDNDEYIEKANLVHNNYYTYPNLVYDDSATIIKIECPIHGEFEQTASEHLKGSGCNNCNSHNIKVNNKARNEFNNKANIAHNFKYDYSKYVYVNNVTKSIIICSIHGEFEQTPTNHLHGGGCPDCKYERMINTMLERYGEIWINHCPRHNPNSIMYLDLISEKLNIHIQHALNGGEKKFQRYWIDGYIEKYNICLEWNEVPHNFKKRKEKDKIRDQYLINNFGCNIIRIKEKEFLKDINNQLNIVVDKIKQIINN